MPFTQPDLDALEAALKSGVHPFGKDSEFCGLKMYTYNDFAADPLLYNRMREWAKKSLGY